MQQPSAFTATWNGIANSLVGEVQVSDPLNPVLASPTPTTSVAFEAIWDTGATNTVITQNVVSKLNLKEIRPIVVSTAAGLSNSWVYLVSLHLPNNIVIPAMSVTLGDLGNNSADLLIGMDVINQGDFVVTNKDGNTKMSFRMPSCCGIDFVQQIESAKSKKPGRNDPCLCGSGQKYKKCCGA